MYRDIPKKFDCKEIASQLKTRLLFSEEIDNGVVVRIAAVLKCSKEKVYKTLDGHIELDLDFLHAAVIGSEGDPEVRKYLEPGGFELRRAIMLEPDRDTLAEECLDDIPTLAAYHAVLNSPKAVKSQVQKAMAKVIDKIGQNYTKWCHDHGIRP